MLVAQYNVGDNVNVDGRDAIITKVDTESWVTGGVQPYYWVRLECDGSRELHAEEDINSDTSCFLSSLLTPNRKDNLKWHM